MLCSNCKKNSAVIFINTVKNNKTEVEGLCYNCAKEKGINPLDVLAKQANLSQEDINNMSKQFESLVEDLSSSFENNDATQESNSLGSIFSNMFGGDNFTQDTSEDSNNSNTRKKIKVDKKGKDKKRKFLDTFGTNLTNKAKQGELDAVIGRNKEIQRIIQILNRRSKNNPCLIGEPGVGKTAIAQGLAIRIADKKVPAKLLNKEVYLIDMTAIVAGTQFRGQFEARMKSLIDECKSLRQYYFGN